jgi:hypothetical protein
MFINTVRHKSIHVPSRAKRGKALLWRHFGQAGGAALFQSGQAVSDSGHPGARGRLRKNPGRAIKSLFNIAPGAVPAISRPFNLLPAHGRNVFCRKPDANTVFENVSLIKRHLIFYPHEYPARKNSDRGR